MEVIIMSISDLIPWKRNRNISVNKSYPFHSSLQKEVNRLFDDFGRNWDIDFPFNSHPELQNFRPDINLAESDNEYVVTAELPGMDEKDVTVELRNGGLIITGEKKNEKEEKKDGYIYSERSYGSFSRQVPLPDEVNPDSVEAEFKKGILKIKLPKTEKAKAEHKRIDIKTE